MENSMAGEMIRFFAVMTAILSGIHLFLYLSFRQLLGLKNSNRILISFLVVAGASFPLAGFLNRVTHSFATQALAAASGFWFALALYLVILFSLVWVALGTAALVRILRKKNSPRPKSALFPKVMMTLVGAVALFCLYGVSCAWRLHTTQVEIKIKNLPPGWEGKKIVHLSDLHLGAIWGNTRLGEIADIIDEIEPEMVVITGDLFDGSAGWPEVFLEGLKRLARTKTTRGVFFTSGNHERFSGYEKIIETLQVSGIRLLENSLVNLDGVQLIGIAYPDLTNPRAMRESAWHPQQDPAYNAKLPTILLYHTPNEFNNFKESIAQMQQSAYTSPDTNFANAQKLGVDLQLSGHTHAGQFFPFTMITQRLYNGFHYGLHRVGDFQIYVHAGTGTWGPPVRHIYPSEIALITLKR